MMPWLILAGAGAAVPLVAWVVYPWLMIRLGERRPPPATGTDHSATMISVIIATREAPAAVRARLADVVAGEWPAGQMEVIVAIDGDPAPYQFPDLHPAPRRLEVLSRGAEPGKAPALNAGVAAATGEFLVFTDTAQRFDASAIPRLVSALRAGQFGAVSGALEIGNERQAGSPIARYWRMEKRLRAAEARVHSTIGVTGAIYALRRELWRPLPAGLILDDLWIPMQVVMAGHRVGFEPAAVARDVRTTTAGQEYQRKVRTLTGNLQLVAWQPAVLLPGRNPVWVQLWCHKLLRLATPYALMAHLVGVIGATFAASAAMGWGLVGGGGGLAALLALAPGGVGRRVRGAVGWGLAMQAAILTATWNGLRGRWDVWHRL